MTQKTAKQPAKTRTTRITKGDGTKSKTTPSTDQPNKLSKFSQVASGKCPHDAEALTLEKRTSGDGVYYVCAKGHRWYHNPVIKTCKCLNSDKDGNIIAKAVPTRITTTAPTVPNATNEQKEV